MRRTLTIEEALTPAKTPIALIRLRGRWLRELGFLPGQRVAIQPLVPGFMVLRVVGAEFPVPSQPLAVK